jgi:hypothetical protein
MQGMHIGKKSNYIGQFPDTDVHGQFYYKTGRKTDGSGHSIGQHAYCGCPCHSTLGFTTPPLSGFLLTSTFAIGLLLDITYKNPWKSGTRATGSKKRNCFYSSKLR